MPEFLMNQKTGVVFVRTERLAARKDMVPYDYEKKRPVSAIQAPQTPAADTPEPETDLEEEKERAAALVKEWFGRDVSKVSKLDLAEYAKDQFDIDLEDDTKLKMVLAIEAAKEDL
jgi:hypothetical protein